MYNKKVEKRYVVCNCIPL